MTERPPRLAAGLRSAPDALGRIVVRPTTGQLVRLTAEQWSALRTLPDHPPLPRDQLERLLASAGTAGLLDVGVPAAVTRSVELSIVAPRWLLTGLAPAARAATGPGGLGVGAAVGVGGLIGAVATGELSRALTAPVSPWSLGALAVALACLTLLHEVAHAAALSALGGRPGRLGVRLRPGLPAGFCDVGDVWLLPPHPRRGSVALAGIWTHTVAGGASLAALAATPGLARSALGTTLALFGVIALLGALASALPIGHTDGALARALARDRP